MPLVKLTSDAPALSAYSGETIMVDDAAAANLVAKGRAELVMSEADTRKARDAADKADAAAEHKTETAARHKAETEAKAEAAAQKAEAQQKAKDKAEVAQDKADAAAAKTEAAATATHAAIDTGKAGAAAKASK